MTLLELAHANRDRYEGTPAQNGQPAQKGLKTIAAEDLAKAEKALKESREARQKAEDLVAAKQKELATIRAELAAIATVADGNGQLTEFGGKLIEVRNAEGAAIAARRAEAVAEAQAGAARDRSAAVVQEAAAAAAELKTAEAAAKRRQELRDKLQAEPLSTLQADADAIQISPKLQDAQTEVERDLPAKLLERARQRRAATAAAPSDPVLAELDASLVGGGLTGGLLDLLVSAIATRIANALTAPHPAGADKIRGAPEPVAALRALLEAEGDPPVDPEALGKAAAVAVGEVLEADGDPQVQTAGAAVKTEDAYADEAAAALRAALAGAAPAAAGGVAALRAGLTRAEAALQDYVSAGPARLKQSGESLAGIAADAADKLTQEQKDALQSLAGAGGAAADAEKARDDARDKRDEAQVAYDRAVAAALAADVDADPDDDAGVQAAKTALDDRQNDLDSAQATLDGVQGDLDAWEAAMPDAAWRLLHRYERVVATIAALRRDPAELTAALEQAEQALAAALAKAGKQARRASRLAAERAARAAELQAARQTADGAFSALRGDF